eukprot:3752784-Rhodomonas_salina.1
MLKTTSSQGARNTQPYPFNIGTPQQHTQSAGPGVQWQPPRPATPWQTFTPPHNQHHGHNQKHNWMPNLSPQQPSMPVNMRRMSTSSQGMNINRPMSANSHQMKNASVHFSQYPHEYSGTAGPRKVIIYNKQETITKEDQKTTQALQKLYDLINFIETPPIDTANQQMQDTLINHILTTFPSVTQQPY